MNVEKYVINGGATLHGEVEISGAKNAAVAIIPAALLVDGVCRIENIPQISDADMLLTILSQPGIESSPTAAKAPSPNHWTTREFPTSHFSPSYSSCPH